MRVLGLPVVAPDVVVNRALSDLGALARAARRAPDQLDRLLSIGEELVAIGHGVLELGERIDRRADMILALGERIDVQAAAILALGDRIDARAEGLLELGGQMREIGDQIDQRGAEIVERAGQVARTGSELVGVIPTLERAIEMTTPLEGAIDRVGRLVDRLPGGAARRRPGPYEPGAPTAPPDPSTDRPEPPDDPALGRS
jgi:hypothetical protein